MNFITKLVARIRGNHSVDAAIAGFVKAEQKLVAVGNFHNLQAKLAADAEAAAARAKTFYAAESAKAHDIAARIRALVK